jgi:hypothetical protein
MPFPEEGERDSDWKVFVDALWALQFVKKKCRLTPELSRALYDVSYGITDLAIRIYMAAQWRAIETRVEVISEGLIRSAYRDDFRLMNRILETLKSGNIDPAHLYEDVQLPAVEPVHSNDDLDNAEGDGLRPPTAPPDSGDKNNADTSLASDNTKRSTRSKKPGRPAYDPGDLRRVVPRTGKTEPPPDAYQALLQAGYIRSSTEFAQGGVFV